ncbi:MAG: serine hydrolase [Deltaproteobacteria bacterium]|nr:serine hydrolase [Deltaproteobacteria bacterium]
MRRLRSSTQLTLLTTSAAMFGCNGCPSEGEPVPDTNYCATAETLQEVCDLDAWYAGRYPAVDAIVTTMRNTVPNPGTSTGQHDSFVLGCSYGVAIDGETLFFGTDGLATPQRARRITDVAGVASVSKSMTALTIHALFEDGVLPGSIETTTVGDLLPGAPADIAALTVHQLLAHTSGLDRASYLAGYGSDAGVADTFPELDQPGLHPRAMWYGLKDANVVDPTLVDEPNNVGNYSNAAYRILGAIIDAYTIAYEDPDGIGDMFDQADIPTMSQAELTQAMQGGYEAAVRSIIAHKDLLPRHRMRTACVDTDNREQWLGADYGPNFRWAFFTTPFGDPANTVAANNIPSGYIPGVDSEPNGRRGPSGGWMMTIGDLLRLATGVSERRFVSEDTLTSMSTPTAVAVGWQFGRGLMLIGTQTFTSDASGVAYPVYGHGGNLSSDGYAAFWRVVDLGGRRVAAAIMCTEDVGSGRLNTALAQITDQVYTDYLMTGAAQSAVQYDLSVAGCEPTPKTSPFVPSLSLVANFGPELHELFRGYYLANGQDLARTEAAIRADVGALPDGAKILRAWDGGDVDKAAALALRAIEAGQVDLYPWLRTGTTDTTGTTATSITR